MDVFILCPVRARNFAILILKRKQVNVEPAGNEREFGYNRRDDDLFKLVSKFFKGRRGQDSGNRADRPNRERWKSPTFFCLLDPLVLRPTSSAEKRREEKRREEKRREEKRRLNHFGFYLASLHKHTIPRDFCQALGRIFLILGLDHHLDMEDDESL